MAKVYGPYASSVKKNGFVFTAGQIGLGQGAQHASTDLETQIKTCFQNLEAALKEQDVAVKDVIKVVVYLVDMGDFAVMNKLYKDFFAKAHAVRSTVGVAELPRIGDVPLKIEVEAVALCP